MQFYLLTLLLTARQSLSLLPSLKECNYKNGEEELTLHNRVWNITLRSQTIFFSACSDAVAECNSAATACLLERGQFKYLAKRFYLNKDEDDEVNLLSQGGEKCHENPERNYTLTVKFDCRKAMKIQPKFVPDDDDPCSYSVTMMHPTCQLPCATTIHGNVIDFRPYKKFGDITVPSPNGTYVFRFCAAADKCGDHNTAACFKLNNDAVIPIAKVDSQKLSYSQKNGLVLKGKYNYGTLPNEYNTLEIVLRCNWKTELGNSRYIVPQKQGRNYKFIVDSSQACIKLPMQCKTVDHNQAKYDLSPLFKKTGFWRVQNYSAGALLMNICGQMDTKLFSVDLDNDCSRTDAQICHVKGKTYESRGSLYSDIIVDNDVLHLTLTEGSACKKNVSVTSKTEVEFKCNAVEKGPVFKSEINCTSHVLWETPKACPYYEYSGTSCVVIDELGKRNLSGIHTDTDKTVRLSKSSMLAYNLCGTLRSPCAGHENVSACLTKNKQEFVIGWENTALKSFDGILSLDLAGNRCPDNTESGINVNFVCDYSAETASYDVKVIKDNCRYNVTVKTALACLTQTKSPCSIVVNGNFIYDLSALSRNSSNYVVRDPSNMQLEYHINVGLPVVTSSDALCPGVSTVCQRNTSDFNTKRKFKNLASVQQLTFDNNRLKMESNSEYCYMGQNYRTVIYFECSPQEEGPRLVEKSRCGYEFLWRTPHSCARTLLPSHEQCILHDTNSGLNLNLTDIKQKKVTLKNDNTTDLTFNICSDNYTKCNIPSGRCETINTKKTIVYKSDTRYVDIELNSTYTLRVNFECGTNDGFISKHFQTKTKQSSLLELFLRSETFCDSKGKNSYKTETKMETVKTTTYHLNESVVSYPLKCLNPEFNISGVQPISVTSNGSITYKFLFKNIFTATTSITNCPEVKVDDLTRDIFVNFKSKETCNGSDFFVWDINFTCVEANSYAQITSEDTCYVAVKYFTAEVCHIFITSSSATVTAVAVSITVIVVAGLAGLYFYIRRIKSRYSTLTGEDKSSVRVYLRNCRN